MSNTNTAMKAATTPRAKPTKATALKVAAPARSPERAALADALNRRLACEQAELAGRMAVERARTALVMAEERLDQARAGVAQADDQRAAELAAEVASGGKPTSSNATRRARTLVEDCEHELNAATAALAKVRANQGTLEDALLRSQNVVVACADIVLRTAAEKALGAAETAALKLRELMPVLWYFLDPRITPQDSLSTPRYPAFSLDWNDEVRTFGKERAAERSYAAGDAVRVRDGAFNEELGPAIQRFVEAPPHLNGREWHRLPSLGPWHKCREALIAGDADAPLPPLPA